jgi:hypothetical protein
MMGKNGLTKTVLAQTAYVAAQRCGWMMSEVDWDKTEVVS